MTKLKGLSQSEVDLIIAVRELEKELKEKQEIWREE